jgi:DNA-binding NtrC family response regulator
MTTWTCPCEFPMRRDAETCWCGGAWRPVRRVPTTSILPTEQLARVAPGYDGMLFQDAKREALRRFTRDYFAPLLARCRGNISAIAREAGIERGRLRNCLKAVGLR